LTTESYAHKIMKPHINHARRVVSFELKTSAHANVERFPGRYGNLRLDAAATAETRTVTNVCIAVTCACSADCIDFDRRNAARYREPLSMPSVAERLLSRLGLKGPIPASGC
jgi:hypothetical protein